MRSGKSCFNKTVFWNDLRRCWPLTAGYALLWLLILPLIQLRTLTRYRHIDPEELVYNIKDILGTASTGGFIIAAIFGIFFAMAMFSYLTNTRATNGIHTLPARRETFYLSHYIAGLVCQIGPQIIALLLTALIAAGTGIFDLRITALSLLGMVLPTLFFYSFGVFCMMFTGQILAAPVFYAALNFVVVGVESLVRLFASNFLFGSSGVGALRLGAFSPFYKMIEVGVGAVIPTLPGTGVPMAADITLRGFNWLLIYAAVGLVFAALGVIVYRARRSEDTGTIVAVRWARPIFKYGVTFCAALALGQLLYFLFYGQYYMNGVHSMSGILICMAASGLIGYFAAEMLLKKSFRVFKSGWKGAAAVTAVLVALALVLSFDLTGYESRVPAADDIAYAEVQLNPYNNNSSAYFVTDDAQTLSLVTEAHRAVIKDKARQQSEDTLEAYNNYSFSETRTGAYFYVRYTLKNGKTIERKYQPVSLFAGELGDAASPAAALTKLYNSEEVVLARTLRCTTDYGYTTSLDYAKLRFTGGYYSGFVDYNEPALVGDHQSDYQIEFTAEQAKAVYDAVCNDIRAGRVNRSLFDKSGSYPEFSVTLYASIPRDSVLNIPSAQAWTRDDADANFEQMMCYCSITNEMTATIEVLRSFGAEPSFE